MPSCLALDVGGTKVAVGLVDDAGDILHQRAAPTPRGDDPEALFGVVRGLVEEALAVGGTAPEVCGVGTAGPMTPGGATVSPVNVPAWRSFPLRRRLEALAGIPVFIDVDAKALALAEGWKGAAAGHQDYLAMVVSTGVGGGIVLDGRLLDGRLGNAGHVGHVIVVPGGRGCGCGGRGCLEAEASGTAIAAITGKPPAEASSEVVRRTGLLVGQAVASVANLLDLDLAVVAGSVALGFGAPFFEAAQQTLDELCKLEHSSGARIVAGGLGADGPLVGAAAVAWRSAGSIGDGRRAHAGSGIAPALPGGARGREAGRSPAGL